MKKGGRCRELRLGVLASCPHCCSVSCLSLERQLLRSRHVSVSFSPVFSEATAVAATQQVPDSGLRSE